MKASDVKILKVFLKIRTFKHDVEKRMLSIWLQQIIFIFTGNKVHSLKKKRFPVNLFLPALLSSTHGCLDLCWLRYNWMFLTTRSPPPPRPPSWPFSTSRTSECYYFSVVTSLLPSSHNLPDLTEPFYWSEGLSYPLSPTPPHGINCLVKSASAGLLHLPLSGFSFHCSVLEGTGHFVCELVKQCQWTRYLLKMRKQCSCCTFFLDVQKASQSKEGKTLYPIKASMVLEKNLNCTLLNFHTRLLPTQTSISPWRTTHFLDEQVKLTRRLTTTWLISVADQSQVGWGHYLFQRFTLKPN